MSRPTLCLNYATPDGPPRRGHYTRLIPWVVLLVLVVLFACVAIAVVRDGITD